MKIVLVSDTHQRHEQFGRLEGDVLIHCGDMFNLFDDDGPDATIAAMDRWFKAQDVGLVLCTGGNHDFPLQEALRANPQPFANAVYLQDASYEYGGKTFWGAPWVPQLSGHAFFATERELEQKWSQIPQGIDVLVTHAPPMSILDRSSGGYGIGCADLLQAVNRVRPALHCFGHVHHSRGQATHQGTTFVNASSIQRGHAGVLPPIVVEV